MDGVLLNSHAAARPAGTNIGELFSRWGVGGVGGEHYTCLPTVGLNEAFALHTLSSFSCTDSRWTNKTETQLIHKRFKGNVQAGLLNFRLWLQIRRTAAVWSTRTSRTPSWYQGSDFQNKRKFGLTGLQMFWSSSSSSCRRRSSAHSCTSFKTPSPTGSPPLPVGLFKIKQSLLQQCE